MARANLSRLLGAVEAPELVVTPALPAETPNNQGKAARRIPASTPRRVQAEATEPANLPGGSYLRFVRKDTRLRDDQLESLTAQARRLNRKRCSAGPRVTENTLIRVAVDLLLDRIESASGDDEAALLKSVRR